MGRTNNLRKLLRRVLKTTCSNVYYQVADDNAMYPHIVFTARSINLAVENRNDYIVEIDIWDKSTSAYNVEDMADDVVDALNCQNIPQNEILPTFFVEDTKTILDEDKTIRHKLIRLTVQLNER